MFDGTRVKEMYPVSSVVVVLADKLEEVVDSAGCKIVVGVVMMIVRRTMTTITTGSVLALQYWRPLHNCNLLFNILC